MHKIRIEIRGKVQGVFFRQSAQYQAQALGLSGWIKNLPNGNVLTEARGVKTSLFSFIDWCKEGPVNAKVDDISVQWLEEPMPDTDNTVNLTDFQIIR